LGTGTLFTAIGIFIAAMFGLGMRVDSLKDLYITAFFLGIIETILSFIPIFGWFMTIPLEALALGTISGFVKGFHVHWSDGYPVVAIGALVVLGTRLILNWILLLTIASFIM
jgi:uncharacterized membrane protein YvlD (DUF360 family)